MKKRIRILLYAAVFCLMITGCEGTELKGSGGMKETSIQSLNEVPEYSGEPYVVVNDNVPEFSEEELQDESFEEYSELDDLGRCGEAVANIGEDLMPTEKRGGIGQVKPTGWQTVKYDNVDGKYLYNRCHLIGYQLTAENANKENLITGTRSMNVDGMLPFENMTADYIKETGNHVMYRVNPVYEGDNLVASGVQMEGLSVEDEGEGISFNVFVYNAQPGIEIDYETGNSTLSGDKTSVKKENHKKPVQRGEKYVVNINTRKFHKPSCASVKDMDRSNKKTITGTRDELIRQGYEPCGRCRP